MTRIKIIPTFYTRDKKPTLRLLSALTAVAAVIAAVLIAIGGEKYSAAVCITVAVYSHGGPTPRCGGRLHGKNKRALA